MPAPPNMTIPAASAVEGLNSSEPARILPEKRKCDCGYVIPFDVAVKLYHKAYTQLPQSRHQLIHFLESRLFS